MNLTLNCVIRNAPCVCKEFNAPFGVFLATAFLNERIRREVNLNLPTKDLTRPEVSLLFQNAGIDDGEYITALGARERLGMALWPDVPRFGESWQIININHWVVEWLQYSTHNRRTENLILNKNLANLWNGLKFDTAATHPLPNY